MDFAGKGVSMENSGAGDGKSSFGWWIYLDEHNVKKSTTRSYKS
jgi:hypothetical protein